MNRRKFTILESTCVPLPLENVDTDQIIPARFLSATSREEFGKNLFRDWRYDKNGNEIKDFVLNRPEYGGSILVAGSNFGCGSSREHAVWAIADYGFRAVVSDSFADIFRNNALNNGLLPVEIPTGMLSDLTEQIGANPGIIVKIDLERQIITADETGMSVPFAINSFRKQCLLSGLDNISFLVNMRSRIIEYEKSRGGPG
ncbi:MAG: 3-isopropylmalate dehydratase small subunit [Bacteroidales bacterium]|nr:3-isopropylmalate dehydratase small subunit [Bacteroidales bacterium]MDT8373759.1 3-isopropylmalate dehydratase small subunit [Bacteroidales bacterium]